MTRYGTDQGKTLLNCAGKPRNVIFTVKKREKKSKIGFINGGIMFLVSQNKRFLINAEVFDKIYVDGREIIAEKEGSILLLGSYKDESAALKEFSSLIDNLEKVIVME